MKQILAVLLLIPSLVLGEDFSRFDEYYTLTCHNETENYFIKPSDVDYVLVDVKTGLRCFSAKDTNGNTHLLCKTPLSKDICNFSLVTEM